MAGEPQGLASFPGVNQIVDATYSNILGIRPGVIVLTIAPQPNFFAEAGDLVFTFGSEQVRVVECKVDQASIERNERGEVWRMTLFDRRWKWEFGAVLGSYNLWRDDFSLRNGEPPKYVVMNQAAQQAMKQKSVNTERTPQELAELFLDAMGETGYDVSALPNESRPTFESNYDNPAQFLAELAESLGCRVALRLDNTVAIVRVGQGASLPQGGELVDSFTLDSPEKPDSIAVVCGPTRYQVDFELEAVGIDAGRTATGDHDELLAHIDLLSYKPANGWATVKDLDYFTSIDNGQTGRNAPNRALALKSVYKYYRIYTPVKLPGYDLKPTKKRHTTKEEKKALEDYDGNVKSLELITPIYGETVDMAVVSLRMEPGPAYVYGVWYDELNLLQNTLPELDVPPPGPPQAIPNTLYRTAFILDGYSIDEQRGLVIFNRPVFRNTDPAAGLGGAAFGSSPTKMTPGPARLVLRASCNVRDKYNFGLERYVRFRDLGGNLRTNTKIIHKDEIVLTYKPEYDPGTYRANHGDIDRPSASGNPDAKDNRSTKKVTDNKEEVDKQCDYWIDAALREYEASAAQQKTYPGLRPTNLDGAIWQAIYSVGPNGCTTLLARNSENLNYTLSDRERRRLDWIAKYQADEKSRLKKQHLDSRRAAEKKTRHLHQWAGTP